MKNLKTLALLLSALSLSSCAVVGYSSGSGLFFWPGGWIGAIVMIVGMTLWYFFSNR